jgi:hypothetical protein
MTSTNPRVGDTIKRALTAVFEQALRADVRECRVRFTKEGPAFHNFVWIMVDRTQVTVEGSEEKVDGLWAHTNDFCFLTGAAASFSAAKPIADAESLLVAAIEFVEQKMGSAERVELLLQTSLVSGYAPNFIADSDSGWDAVHEQPEHFTD